MANRHVSKVLNKALEDVEKFLKKSKTQKEQKNFKKKQLTFLKGGVSRPKMPFKRVLLKLERRQKRKMMNKERKKFKETTS
ncbi:hypothetical protein NUSPORA_00214 [Nucleospora cyclopteri]